MKQVIIDGNNFSNLEGFFNEIERLLAPNHNFHFLKSRSLSKKKKNARIERCRNFFNVIIFL